MLLHAALFSLVACSSVQSQTAFPSAKALLESRRLSISVDVLHTFTGKILPGCSAQDSPDGALPSDGLSEDSQGNLYGTTETGGPCGAGTVFEFIRSGTAWGYRVLYAFSGLDDGGAPGALTFDRSGNAFGTADYGGTHGDGVVFELSPSTDGGKWSERVLYNFRGLPDGSNPIGDLAFGANGDLFGATNRGGHSHIGCLQGCGIVFRLMQRSGKWKERVLHRFLDALKQGANPLTGVTMDPTGNIYGVTYYGGDDLQCSGLGCGTVYELASKNGKYRYKTLHVFEVTDGAFPNGELSLSDDELFGTTMYGGASNDGTLFEFQYETGHWRPAHRYDFNDQDGKEPSGSLNVSGAEILGTTFTGGSHLWGTIYRLTTAGSSWQEQVLYSYTGGADGASPAQQGGEQNQCSGIGCGTVVKLQQ
jgi:uncharacterized repeat protein (TIGR03803 family)